MYLNILQSIFVSWISPSFKKMALKLLIVFSFQLKVIPEHVWLQISQLIHSVFPIHYKNQYDKEREYL